MDCRESGVALPTFLAFTGLLPLNREWGRKSKCWRDGFESRQVRDVAIAPDVVLPAGTYAGKGLKTLIGIEYIVELTTAQLAKMGMTPEVTASRQYAVTELVKSGKLSVRL